MNRILVALRCAVGVTTLAVLGICAMAIMYGRIPLTPTEFNWVTGVGMFVFAVWNQVEEAESERLERRVEEFRAWFLDRRSRSARGTTSFAAMLAGSRREIREAWLADLAGDPENGMVPTPKAQRRLARGFLVAAVTMRLRDLAGPLWRPVDWVLGTANRTNAVITLAVGALALYIDATDGLHALLVEAWHPCAILGAGLYGLAHWLRGIRGIEPNNHTESNDSVR
ncbi:hypothetical protein [Embleya sp. NPDC020630]|uniref:hypothetical protein n=1 Tax=Embleya sp. NPDC020630 TaxID=3363979 RepID=UPI00379474F0